jgi:hypothetical protein
LSSGPAPTSPSRCRVIFNSASHHETPILLKFPAPTPGAILNSSCAWPGVGSHMKRFMNLILITTALTFTFIALATSAQASPENAATRTARPTRTPTLTRTPTSTRTITPTPSAICTRIPTRTRYPTRTSVAHTSASAVILVTATPIGPRAVGNAPAGATARCVDGTYSYSQHRRGTCSKHGGVAEWLAQLPP